MVKHRIFQKAGLFSLTVSLIFTSCSKDDDPTPDDGSNTLEVVTVNDLDGATKGYACFSLEKRQEVEESSADWDFKISGTTISFGNGASGQLAEGILSSYSVAPESGYASTDIGGSNSYYTYTNATEPQHAVLMKPGVLIIVKTGKGKYAKIEMVSYYKGNPNVNTPDFANIPTRQERTPKQYYTFNYVIQPNGTNKF